MQYSLKYKTAVALEKKMLPGAILVYKENYLE